MATARLLGARRGRPSFDGIQASLTAARESNTRLIEANVNLALELRARRREGRVFARRVVAGADLIRNLVAAGNDAADSAAINAAGEIAALADRHLAQSSGGIL